MRRRWIRHALAALIPIAVAVVGLAGCQSTTGGRSTHPTPSATPSPSRVPAQASGGACQLIDFPTVASMVGIDFGVAAAAQKGGTFTCVLEQVGTSLPSLTLSITATQADISTFRNTVVPSQASIVDQLGKIGYSLTLTSGSGSGPGEEIGWLSADQRLVVLQLRLPPGSALGALGDRLLTYARKLDMTSA